MKRQVAVVQMTVGEGGLMWSKRRRRAGGREEWYRGVKSVIGGVE